LRNSFRQLGHIDGDLPGFVAVSSLAAARRARLLLAGDANYEAGIGLLDLPQRWEAATCQLLRPVGQRQQSSFFPQCC
jgi:hypothetical protein